MKHNITSAQLLKDFNIDNLDLFEQRQYDHLIRQSSKPEVLQILINSCNGDFSELSDALASIAYLQECENNELITF